MILFFTIIVAVLSKTLPPALLVALTDAGLKPEQARRLSALPPTSALFATILGYNPIQSVLPADVLSALPVAARDHLLSREFFPHLIAAPLMRGLSVSFYIAAALSLLAAAASMLRGRQTYGEQIDESAARSAMTSRPSRSRAGRPPL